MKISSSKKFSPKFSGNFQNSEISKVDFKVNFENCWGKFSIFKISKISKFSSDFSTFQNFRMKNFSTLKLLFISRFFLFVALWKIVSPYVQATSISQNCYLSATHSEKCDGLQWNTKDSGTQLKNRTFKPAVKNQQLD